MIDSSTWTGGGSGRERGVSRKPVLALTMGDVAGIGPEIIAKVSVSPELRNLCIPVVIGDSASLGHALSLIGADPGGIRVLDELPEGAGADLGDEFAIIEPHGVDVSGVRIGAPDACSGAAGVKFVEKAAGLAMSGLVDGIVTAPLNKEAIHLAGCEFAGHTELLGQITGTESFRMMLVVDGYRVVHVTTHVSMREMLDMLSQDRITETIELARDAMTSLGLRDPRIGVSGVNPHAGEAGLFGREEIDVIEPCVRRLRDRGWNVTGPVPPDTILYRNSMGEFDCLVVMYHDQGHIPLKLIGFDRGVNVTLGLPIIRTSPDHGTACDIAGKGVARPDSMMSAIRMAVDLARERRPGGNPVGSGSHRHQRPGCGTRADESADPEVR